MTEKNPIKISPFHDIPRNSTDLEYSGEVPTDGGSNGGDLGTIELVGRPRGLNAPGWVDIKSYTVKTAADGSQVVDVTFECEDIPGAAGYNIRVTKVAE